MVTTKRHAAGTGHQGDVPHALLNDLKQTDARLFATASLPGAARDEPDRLDPRYDKPARRLTRSKTAVGFARVFSGQVDAISAFAVAVNSRLSRDSKGVPRRLGEGSDRFARPASFDRLIYRFTKGAPSPRSRCEKQACRPTSGRWLFLRPTRRRFTGSTRT